MSQRVKEKQQLKDQQPCLSNVDTGSISPEITKVFKSQHVLPTVYLHRFKTQLKYFLFNSYF